MATARTFTKRSPHRLHRMVGSIAMLAALAGAASAADVPRTPVITPSGTSQSSGNLTFTITFSDAPEGVFGFDASNLVIVDGTGTNTFVQVTDKIYRVNITGAVDGETVSVTTVAGDLGDWLADGNQEKLTVVAGSVVIDSTAPLKPTVANPDGVATIGKRPTITGKVEKVANTTDEVGATVTIYKDGSAIGTATTNATGEYAFTLGSDLANGTYAFKVKAADAAGNASVFSDIKNVIIWDEPTLTSYADNARVIDNTPTLSGACSAGVTITVAIDGVADATDRVTGAGVWAYTPTALSEGSHTFVITQTNGSNTLSVTKTLVIDATAPAPVTLTPVGANLDGGIYHTSNNTPSLVVTGFEPLADLVIDAKGPFWNIAASGIVGASKTITVTGYDPSAAGVVGGAEIYVRSGDAAGVYTVASVTASTIVVSEAIVDSTATTIAIKKTTAVNVTSEGTFVTGTAGALSAQAISGIVGSTKTITFSAYVPTAAVASGGVVAGDTIQILSGAAKGNYTVASRTATTVVVSETIPDSTAVEAFAFHAITVTGVVGSTKTITVGGGYDPTVAVGSGGVVAGDNIYVKSGAALGMYTVASRDATHIVVNETIPDSGAAALFIVHTPIWTIAADGTADDGEAIADSLPDIVTLQLPYRFFAVQSDLAGNVSDSTPGGAGERIELRVKTSVAAPVITGPAITNVITKMPLVVGTGEPGATIELRMNTNPLPTITVDGSGDWSYQFDTQQADNVYSLTARQTDLADGSPNAVVSGYSAFSMKLDTTDPPAPVITSPAIGISTPDTTPTFIGTAEVGSTVKIKVDGVVKGTVATTAGAWTFTLDNADALTAAAHTISAYAIDPAGNDGPDCAGRALTVAGTGVAVVLAQNGTQPAAGTITSLASFTIKATLDKSSDGTTDINDVGTTFTASDFTVVGGKVTALARVGTTNVWTATVVPTILAGPLSVSVDVGKLTSTAWGLNAASNTYSLTVDRVKPIPIITAKAGEPVSATHFKDAANDQKFTAEIDFGEVVTGFELAHDLAVSGCTVGNLTDVGGSVGRKYNFDVTMASSTTTKFTIQAKAGVAGAAGLLVSPYTAAADSVVGVADGAVPRNVNVASAVFSRLYDKTAPGKPIIACSIGASNPLAPSKLASYPCSVKFTESVMGFDASDLVVVNGIISNFAGANAAYTFTLTMAEGMVTVDLIDKDAVGAPTDLAGFKLTSNADQFVRVLDSQQPKIAQVYSPLPTDTDFANTVIPVTLVFSESVVGFNASKLKVSGATIGPVTGAGATYSFDLTVTGTGTAHDVSLVVPAGAAGDGATNVGAASALISFGFDPAADVLPDGNG